MTLSIRKGFRALLALGAACALLAGAAATAGADTVAPEAWGKAIDFSDPLDGVADETTVSTSTIDLELNADGTDGGNPTVQEDRAVFEFDLATLSPCGLDTLTLRLPVYDAESAVGTVKVYAYAGNGSLDLADFEETGTLVTTATITKPWLAVDVTSAVQDLLADGETTVGFLVALTAEDQLLSIWNVGDQGTDDFGDPELAVTMLPSLLPEAWGKAIDFSDPLDGVADETTVSTSTIDLELNADGTDGGNPTVQEDRAVFEFDLSTAAPWGVASAKLCLPVSYTDSPATVTVHAYAADGSLDLADFGETGTAVATVTVTEPWLGVDVTSAVSAILAGGDTGVGFLVVLTVEDQQLSIWNVGDQGFGDFGDPHLVVVAADAPEPGTVDSGKLQVFFKKDASDSLMLSGSYSTGYPADVSNGLTGTFRIGGWHRGFTMKANGQSKPDTVIRVALSDSSGSFAVQVKKADLSDALDLEDETIGSPGTTIEYEWSIELANGWSIGGTVKFLYTAKAGKHGMGSVTD